MAPSLTSKRLPRIYCATQLITGAKVKLDPQASKRLLRVLRLRPGAKIKVFDGQGNEFIGTLTTQEDGSTACITLEENTTNTSESPLLIHLGQGISRGDKMDYILQKAVELGVHEVTPLFTQFCEVNLDTERLEKRLEHWRAIIIHATEQCGRSYLPRLNPAVTLKHWLSQQQSGMRLFLTPSATQTLRDFSLTCAHISLAIGPEGGFSEEELCAAEHQGFRGWRFGPRILRTETAGLAAISALQTRWGDMG